MFVQSICSVQAPEDDQSILIKTLLCRICSFENLSCYSFYCRGVDFQSSGDFSVMKRTVPLIKYYLVMGGRWEISWTSCFPLVDQGNFSILTSLSRSEFLIGFKFRLPCSSQILLPYHAMFEKSHTRMCRLS